MKTLLLSTIVTLTVASFAPVAKADYSFNYRPATTGGAISEQYRNYVREHNNGVQQQSTSSSIQPKSVDTSAPVKPLTRMEDNSKDCRSVVIGGTTGGAIRQQLEAMAKCRVGR